MKRKTLNKQVKIILRNSKISKIGKRSKKQLIAKHTDIEKQHNKH